MHKRPQRVILLALVSSILLLGCVKQPTHSETAVDLRPALSFSNASAKTAANYAVYVDGLAMGSADQYLEGKAALRVLSGSHLIQIKENGSVIMQQKLYLGDSTVKTLPLPRK